MNDDRRYEIDKALIFAREAYSIIELVCSDEKRALEKMPNKLRESSQGESMKFSVDCLKKAITDFDTVINYLEYSKIKSLDN